jgi:hypothetical protein
MQLVENILTRATYADVFDSYTASLRDILDEEPSTDWVNVLCAQSAFETAYWRAMHDWNTVNLRGSWHGSGVTFKGAGELDEHGHEVILPPGPGNTFRAYPGLRFATDDVVLFLFTQSRPDRPNRYAAAADAARAGDVAGFVKNLRGPNPDGTWTINGERLGGFFTAVPHVYLVGCQDAFARLQKYDEP